MNKNKLYFTGDTHGEGLLSRLWNIDDGDTLCILGDFGYVWKEGDVSRLQHLSFNILEPENKSVVVVLGNHENYDIIEQLPQVEKYGGIVYEVSSHIHIFKQQGLYEVCGHKLAVYGGGLSVDKDRRQLGVSYWKQEIPTNRMFDCFMQELSAVDTSEYILLSHVCEKSLVEKLLWKGADKLLDDTTEHLQMIKDKYNFQHHYFGHFHDDIETAEYSLLWENVIEAVKGV